MEPAGTKDASRVYPLEAELVPLAGEEVTQSQLALLLIWGS